MIWLVNHPDNLAAALAQPEDVLLVTSSAYIHASLEKAGRSHVLLHQWYDDKAMTEATTVTQQICQKWYTFEGKDFTRLGDDSLGLIFEWYLTNCLSYSIEPLVATWGTGAFVSAMIQYGQLFERYTTAHVCHDWPPSAAAETLAIFCQARNIRCEKIHPQTDPDSLSLLRPAVQQSLKIRLLNRAYPYTSTVRRVLQRLKLRKERRNSHRPLRRVATLHYASLEGLASRLAEHQITLIPAMPWFLAPQPFSARQARSLAAFRQIESRWQTLGQNTDYRRLFHINGIDCSDFFVRQFDALMANQMKQAAWQLGNAEHFLRSQKIEAVLLPFDAQPQARILILAARKVGIPTIVVQHGMMALAQEHCDQPELTFADHALVLSQADADDLIRRFPQKSPRVTGCLQLDQIAPAPANLRTDRLKVLVLGLCPSGLFDTSTDSADFMRQVVEGLNHFESQISVTFKMHPADSLKRYDQLMPLLAPRFPWTMQTTGSLHALLAQADVVISCVSTGVGEALAMGRPVVFIPPPHRIIPTGFLSDRNGLPTAHNADQLASLLKPAIDDLPGYLRTYDFDTHLRYYRPEGARPTQRLIEHLDDILTHRHV